MEQVQEKYSYRRRNIFIDKDFQSKFVLKFCALVAAGAGLLIVVLYVLGQQSMSVAFVQARVKVMTTADFLLPFMLQTVLVVMGVVSIATIAVTLFVSHKIAGPLYRFRQTFRELSDGNFSRQVYLRKGDQLVEVAGDFNHMITVVRARLADAQKALAALRFDVEAIGELNADDERKKKVQDLQLKVLELQKTLEFFKI